MATLSLSSEHISRTAKSRRACRQQDQQPLGALRETLSSFLKRGERDLEMAHDLPLRNDEEEGTPNQLNSRILTPKFLGGF